MLRLVLPKGSLELATFELFAAADLTVRRASEVAYRATIDDPRIDEVHILRPQEIPTYVAEGLFDLGVTGRDWVEETGADVVGLGELRYSKATAEPIKVVLAVSDDSPVRKVDDLPPGCRISTEYPGLTRRFLAERGLEADVRFSFGATEAKIPDIADAVVEITETGRATTGGRPAGDRHPHVVLHRAHREPRLCRRSGEAPRHGPAPRVAAGGTQGRGKVLVKLNVPPPTSTASSPCCPR